MLRRDHLLLLGDLGGTFVFAIEGALAAIQGHLDLMGIMVLSCAAATGGGIIRDVLIAATPPNAVRDWRYAAVAIAGGVVAYGFHPPAGQSPNDLILVLDAAGLALFASVGTQKALLYGINPLIAVFMGTWTAVGGGVAQDVLLAQVPRVLRADFYATAAVAGSVAIICCRRIGLSTEASSLIGGGLCFVLRLVGVWQHWRLPT
jgi:uncharacterized membrane protein YeiH